MNKKKKEYFKRLLSRQLNELLERSGDTVGGISELKDKSPDFTDQATLESDMDFNLHLRERESKLIGKIKEALERIEDDAFGICEGCGENITEKRLKARPVTTLCIDCKRREENNERLRGV